MEAHFLRRSYEINSFLVNPQKKLGLYSLLNLFQDTAWAHATRVGFGYEDSIKRKVFWVLSRQKVTMDSWPEWGATVDITTWIRPLQKSFASRDYEIHSGGRKIGESTTSWVLLDAETRRPTTIDFQEMKDIVRAEGMLALEAPKIELRQDLQTRAQFQVRNSDLDMNEHVNNTKYAQWILDSLPNEWLHKFHLHAYEVNFLAETRSQDLISIQSESQPDLQKSEGWVHYQGLRESDQKVVFAARLKVSLKNQ